MPEEKKSVMTREQLEALISAEVEKQIRTSAAATGTELSADHIAGLVEDKVKSLFEAVNSKIDKMLPKIDHQGEKDPTGGFKCMSEFAAVVRNADTGRGVDTRLKAAGSGLSENDSEYGGYLVPTEFSNQILAVALKMNNLLQYAMIIPMATNSISIPYVNDSSHASTVYGGITFYWLDEAGEITSSRPKIGNVNLRLKKLAGMCYMTDEIIQDSPISAEPLITRLFGEGLGWTIEGVMIAGSGAGKPLGVLSAPCFVSISKESTQLSSTILYENILKMYARMYDAGKGKGIWLANGNTLPQLGLLAVSVGSGGSAVFVPAGGASASPYNTLLGRPLFFTEHCKTLGTVGDILFGDWSQYLVGQKSGAGAGVQFATSIHLKFDFAQTAYRIITRIDGQPWWSTAQTPENGTDTVSPFIGIETR